MTKLNYCDDLEIHVDGSKRFAKFYQAWERQLKRQEEQLKEKDIEMEDKRTIAEYLIEVRCEFGKAMSDSWNRRECEHEVAFQTQVYETEVYLNEREYEWQKWFTFLHEREEIERKEKEALQNELYRRDLI